MINYLSLLEPDKYYHIYNHAVGNRKLFIIDNNYLYFLKKYVEYINPFIDTFAYCLMPNHFHLAVRVKSEKEIQEIRTLPKFRTLAKLNISNFISKQFSNLFSSYTQSLNKQEKERGTLFEKPFKRLYIDTNNYFKHLIHYIHYNPVHHCFVKDLREWKYTSYEAFFSEKATNIKREEVIQWFNNKENFWQFHQKEIDEKISLELEF